MDARQEKNCFIVVIIVLNIMIVIIVIVIMVVIIVLMILMITIATINIKVATTKCPGSLTSSSSTTAEQRERLLYALICKSQRFLLFSVPLKISTYRAGSIVIIIYVKGDSYA